MYRIRRAKIDDVATLLKLAKMVHFINLPPDKDIITEKVIQSRRSFGRAAEIRHGAGRMIEEPDDRESMPSGGLASVTADAELFMFVLEDTDSGGVLGSSQVLSHMGGLGAPNVSFKLDRVEKFSKSLQTGVTHVTATLRFDESGPTEIGGLILQPSFRGHKMKLGRFLSFVRFHFLGLYREMFADRVLAEMMAPITADGRNMFWEALGRQFINLSYEDADRFCQHSKEFMISLLPHEPIYMTLLPPQARNEIGNVNRETVPARRMLEKLGFSYNDVIDPFDGGPHLDASTDQITLVEQTRWCKLGAAGVGSSKSRRSGLVSVIDPSGGFRCIETEFAEDGSKIRLSKEAMDALDAGVGDNVGVTPITAPANKASGNGASASKRSRKVTVEKAAGKSGKKARSTVKKSSKKG